MRTSSIGVPFEALDQTMTRQNQSKQASSLPENDEIIGKIAFYRDSDNVNRPAEVILGRWVSEFHDCIGPHCLRKPRYTELRPLIFEKLANEAAKYA